MRCSVTIIIVLTAGCGGAHDSAPSQPAAPTYPYAVPANFPLPNVPADNPVSDVKVSLGRHLFYDKRLSQNQTEACATCHQQAKAFTDGLSQSKGSTGQLHPRGAQTLANAGYATSFAWANNVIPRLEAQALIPMFNDSPVELGFNGQEDALLARLGATQSYPALFAQAFPDDATPISLENITKSLASFERTLISGNSPYDRYLGGDTSAMSESAMRGEALFFGEVFECHHCHGSFGMTDAVTFAGDQFPAQPFHNNALYNVDGKGAYPAGNQGLIEVTGVASDMGRFKAPSLRNVAVSAPYMHDGSIATLDEVLDHYIAGGRTIAEGPNAGNGAKSPLRDPLIRAFLASPQDKADVLAFLNALTDDEFLANPAFSEPGDLP